MKLAFDKGSVRSFDTDGRLRVTRTAITMEQVVEYRGHELAPPDGVTLDPDRLYSVYRPGAEIEKAAATSNSIQLLVRHIPVTVDDPQTEVLAGTTGSDAEYIAPYLYNSLSVWTAEAIDLIKSEKQKELSAGYRYRLVPEPGVFQGQPFDFWMADLDFNHVALVERGRAGPTVVVGDSFPPTESNHMSKKAIPTRMSVLARGALLSVMPKLATDHKVDFAKLVEGVTAKNWADRKDGIVATLKPKLAQDVSIDDVVAVINSLTGQSKEADIVAGDEPVDPAMDDDEEEAKKKAEAEKVAKDAEEAAEKEKAEAEEKEKNMKKPAMDAATVTAMVAKSVEAAVAANTTKLRAELQAEARATREAENAVRPYVGELHIAQDSAEGVYRTALQTLGVKVDGVHPSAFPAILAQCQKPGEQRRTHTSIALDSKPDDEFSKMFPNATRLI